MSPSLGRVDRLLRYPVKSLGGEDVAVADVDERGLRGDRLWSVCDPDGKLGSGKSSTRFRRMDGLLDLHAAYDGDVPVLTFPGGDAVRGDDDEVHARLSEHVGRPVTLARESAVDHFDEGPLHLVTTSSLAALAEALGGPLDVRRFRPNLVLDTGATGGFVESAWSGRRLRVGEDLVVEVGYPMPRCVMVDLPPEGAAAGSTDGRSRVLAAVTALNHGDLGVVARVVRAGRVCLGDAVHPL